VKKKSPPYHFILAIALGVLALVFLWHWSYQKDQAAAAAIAAQQAADAKSLQDAKDKQITVPESPTNMRAVLYATQPVEPGIMLSPAFYEKKLTPTDILPDAYTDQSDITGWVAVRKIEKGDPLTPRNINKHMALMSERMTPGMRLISLPIFNSDLNSAGGFIVDGDHVDLLYTIGGQTSLALQNISILYVPGLPEGQKSEKSEGVNPSPAPDQRLSVAFEVTPEEAQALTNLLAVKNGTFSMILRARKDTKEIKVHPFAAADYTDNFAKIQRIVDKSNARVTALGEQIKAQEQSQGTTNETTTPTPPTQ
jgi:Flp pilus assembly protein CpaB